MPKTRSHLYVYFERNEHNESLFPCDDLDCNTKHGRWKGSDGVHYPKPQSYWQMVDVAAVEGNDYDFGWHQYDTRAEAYLALRKYSIEYMIEVAPFEEKQLAEYGY